MYKWRSGNFPVGLPWSRNGPCSPWRGAQCSRCLHCSLWMTPDWSRGYTLKEQWFVESPHWSREKACRGGKVDKNFKNDHNSPILQAPFAFQISVYESLKYLLFFYYYCLSHTIFSNFSGVLIMFCLLRHQY